LVLEAMKMENVIKLPHEAVVKKIHVTKGQAITKGQIMIELA
jgi:biotin carboxyl carrier protein